jgi:predicted porin
MNKKLMALAVAGAFAAPAAAFAQASNVQIYGTAYIEYSYAKQGASAAGSLNNIDQLQTPGSSIGFKGEEALGGGITAWFQCESSMDLKGGGNQAAFTTNSTTGAQLSNPQNSGILCGRNSALGLKGSFGNIFAGNWDTPWKIYNPQIMGTNETGALGTSFLLYGSSASATDASSPILFERRQNSSIMYNTPVMSGFQAGVLVSVPGAALDGITSNATVGKPRVFSVGASYSNGPLFVAGAYETHTNFGALNGTATQKGTTDSGFMVGAAYQFGPVKLGGVYSKRTFDSGCTGTVVALCGDASVSSYGLNADWAIQGPHQLKAAYVHANSTSGSYSTATAGGIATNVLVFNGGAVSTSGSLWELEYLYNFSKRTRVSFGYVNLTQDPASRYNVGGYAQPIGGTSQNAFMTSIKSTF